MICRHCGYKTDEKFCPICGEVVYLTEPPINTAGTFKNPFTEQIRKKLANMTGNEFESFCMSYLSMKGFSDIKQTKGSGDHGVDITAEKDGLTYAIQCKRYSGRVGNKAVQEAYTGKNIYGKDIAVIMTNSIFSSQAMDEGYMLGVKLWDRAKIMNTCLDMVTSLSVI